jgi:hypothetical protein
MWADLKFGRLVVTPTRLSWDSRDSWDSSDSCHWCHSWDSWDSWDSYFKRAFHVTRGVWQTRHLFQIRRILPTKSEEIGVTAGLVTY